MLEDHHFSTTKKVPLHPVDFHIDEFHRFPENTDPAEERIVRVSNSALHPPEGRLVNAFGPDASPMIQEMVPRLVTH